MLREEFGKLLPASADPDHDRTRWKDAAEAKSRLGITDPVLSAEIFDHARAMRNWNICKVGSFDGDRHRHAVDNVANSDIERIA